MNELRENRNSTISLDYINIIMPLISLLSFHFFTNSFALISDTEATYVVKIASKFYLKTNYGDGGRSISNNSFGYLIVGKPEFKFSRIFKKKPKIVVAMYKVGKTDPVVPDSFSEMVIPPSIAFFVIPLLENSTYFHHDNSADTAIKCLRLYKPISNLTLRAFPTMSYGKRDKWKWTWEHENMNWYSFEKEVRKMNEVTIRIALVSIRDRKFAENSFWSGRNSFFWKAMQEHLQFRSELVFRQISPTEARTATEAFIRMLKTEVDGLPVLAAITAERSDHLSFIVTGIDQKYHILVRTPQYVHSWQSIFRPFSLDTWICLAIFILLISVTLRIATCWEKQPTADLSSCCLIIFGFVCSQGCPNVPRNLSSCIICYIALLFSILIYQFYTSNFYSLLSTKEVSLPFTSLEDFLAKQSMSLHVHPETAIYQDIVNAKNGTLKALWDVIKKDPSHQLRVNSSSRIYDKVCKGFAAILGLPYQTIHNKDLKCKLVPVNSGFFPTNTMTALRKAFPFSAQFRYVHLRLKEAGITQKFREKFFHIDQQHKTKTDVINEPVTLIHVCFLFVLHVGSIILSWLILGLEIMTSKTIKKRNVVKDGVHL